MFGFLGFLRRLGEVACVGCFVLAMLVLLTPFDMLSQGSNHFPIEGAIMLFGDGAHSFEHRKREPNRDGLNCSFISCTHVTSILPNWLHVKRACPHHLSPEQGTPLISPCLKPGVLRGGSIKVK